MEKFVEAFQSWRSREVDRVGFAIDVRDAFEAGFRAGMDASKHTTCQHCRATPCAGSSPDCAPHGRG